MELPTPCVRPQFVDGSYCDEDDEEGVVRQSKMLAASSKAEIGYVRSDELEAGSLCVCDARRRARVVDFLPHLSSSPRSSAC